MCCLKYEEDNYEATRKRMPKVGKEVITPDGNGIVVDLNILKETVRVRIPKGDGTEQKDYPLEEVQRVQPAPRPPRPERDKPRAAAPAQQEPADAPQDAALPAEADEPLDTAEDAPDETAVPDEEDVVEYALDEGLTPDEARAEIEEIDEESQEEEPTEDVTAEPEEDETDAVENAPAETTETPEE